MIWHLSMHAIQTRSMLRWNRTQAHLESFLEIARSFNAIYTKEIRPWTHMMEVPQLHGFGLAANRLLEAYKMLWKPYRVIYYFDTPVLGRRHQSFGRVTKAASSIH
ncbi:AUGMIN subunit 7-like isoform X1 [Populus alba]|uniref:AUGMIN subunit 7-like isoform X1 n=1 Tax=Populus alba TaxID=43335 RepID=UPI003CC79157